MRLGFTGTGVFDGVPQGTYVILRTTTNMGGKHPLGLRIVGIHLLYEALSAYGSRTITLDVESVVGVSSTKYLNTTLHRRHTSREIGILPWITYDIVEGGGQGVPDAVNCITHGPRDVLGKHEIQRLEASGEVEHVICG